jgi:hypothetical protein
LAAVIDGSIALPDTDRHAWRLHVGSPDMFLLAEERSMRAILRKSTVAAAAALAMIGLMPAAEAARTVIRVSDMASFEYHKSCSDTPPFPCGTFGNSMFFMVQVSDRPRPYAPITVGFQIDNGTAVAGQDFQGATSGTVTIPANAFQAYVVVTTVVDTVTEPTETFSVRLTSSSVPADISDTAVGTIHDRPADQRWLHTILCGEDWRSISVNGNTVTGNGTSTARCTQFAYNGSHFTVL